MKSIFTNGGVDMEYLPKSMYTKTNKQELYTAITMALFIIIVGGIIILSM